MLKCKINRSISGNIGVGKSTLIKNLSQYFQTQNVVEEELENPHLSDFYEEL